MNFVKAIILAYIIFRLIIRIFQYLGIEDAHGIVKAMSKKKR